MREMLREIFVQEDLEWVYLFKIEVTFPIVMRTENDDYVKKIVTPNVINADEGNFLYGRETQKGSKIKVDMEENKLEFKEQGKIVKLKESEGVHQLVNLEKVGNDFDEKNVNFLREEVDAVVSESPIRKIHKIINHKTKEQMNYAYCNARKMMPQVRK